VHGNLGVAAPLAQRIAAGGVGVEQARADSRFPAGAIHVPGTGGGTWLALTDGRTATKRVVDSGVRDLVLFDLAIDYASAARIAVAAADTCSASAFGSGVGALQAAGVKVSRLDDVAGLAVMRTVAMLANEAADAVVQGVASLKRSISRCRRASTIRAGPSRGPMQSARVSSRCARESCAPLRRGSLPDLAASRAARATGASSVGEHHPP
jgi:3-hydroxybutyryl-CoA dehydrogenase